MSGISRSVVGVGTAVALGVSMAGCGFGGSPETLGSSVSAEAFTPDAAAEAYSALGINNVGPAAVKLMVAKLGVDYMAKDMSDRTTVIKPGADQTLQPLEDDATAQEPLVAPVTTDTNPSSDAGLNLSSSYFFDTGKTDPKTGSTDYKYWETDVIGDARDGQTHFLPVIRVAMKDDGTMTVTDLRPPEVRVATKDVENNYTDLLTNVVKPDESMMRKALAGRVVNQYLFGYDATFNDKDTSPSPYATSGTRVVVNYLYLDGELKSEARMVDRHETTHEVFFPNPASDQAGVLDKSKATQELRKACRVARTTMLSDVVYQDGYAIADKLDAFAKKAPKSSRANIHRLASMFASGYDSASIDALQPKDTYSHSDQDTMQTKDDRYAYSESAPECAIDGPDGMLDTMDIDSGAYNSLKYSKDKALQTVRDVFSDSLRITSIHKAINEHGYVDDERSGHTESDKDEVIASIFDVAVSNPKAFYNNILYGTTDDAEAIIGLYLAAKAELAKTDPAYANQMPSFDFTPWGYPAN